MPVLEISITKKTSQLNPPPHTHTHPAICQLFRFSQVGQKLFQQNAPAAAGGGALVPVLCTFHQKQAPTWSQYVTSDLIR